ncbi:hypothetical protein Zm00014a_039267 [Zea mays]|uniref:Uncharacterized protein n=1 Tax=Zea mays TaxID=4577 RepID=A0A3L6EXP7_MAIZE|nr:hypothetical protein Zm00014a_039267 [Zea mays]
MEQLVTEFEALELPVTLCGTRLCDVLCHCGVMGATDDVVNVLSERTNPLLNKSPSPSVVAGLQPDAGNGSGFYVGVYSFLDTAKPCTNRFSSGSLTSEDSPVLTPRLLSFQFSSSPDNCSSSAEWPDRAVAPRSNRYLFAANALKEKLSELEKECLIHDHQEVPEVIKQESTEIILRDIEVVILGDKIAAHLSLLQKIYLALDAYSPTLQQHPGLLDVFLKTCKLVADLRIRQNGGDMT